MRPTEVEMAPYRILKTLPLFLIVSTLVGVSTAADATLDALCPLLVQQARVDLDERRLDAELAEIDLVAAESIYALMRKLWESDATQRLAYLRAKREHDVAVLEVKRRQLLAIRQDAELEQLRLSCTADEDEGKASADRQRRIDEQLARYRQADCHRIGKDLAIAEIDLAFNLEWRVSVRELREQRVATAQDIILAERNVDAASRRVERHQSRVQACVASGDAAAKAPR